MKKNMCIMFLFGFNLDNFWQYLTILCDTWQHLAIPDNTFTILSNSKQNLPIPSNTKQYLTNLVSVGIAWYLQSIKYHCQYNSNILKVVMIQF
jgi:hypothetical protein